MFTTLYVRIGGAQIGRTSRNELIKDAFIDRKTIANSQPGRYKSASGVPYSVRAEYEHLENFSIRPETARHDAHSLTHSRNIPQCEWLCWKNLYFHRLFFP